MLEKVTALAEELGRMGPRARKQFCWQACKWARPGAGGGAGSKSDGVRKRINRVREVCRLDKRLGFAGGKLPVAKTPKPT